MKGFGCTRGWWPLMAGWWLVTAASPATAASVVAQEFDAAARSKADLAHGEQLFVICAACHASTGGGSANGDVPAIAGQYPRVIMRQLVNYRHGKRWDMRMERIADQHHLKSAQDIADIANYVASLPPQGGDDSGSGEFAAHGGETFRQLCSGCHGLAAQGNEQTMVPRIAGQHYQYLLRQMYDALDGRRPNFSRDHISLFQRFERPELTGIADYLSRLPPVAAP